MFLTVFILSFILQAGSKYNSTMRPNAAYNVAIATQQSGNYES